MKKRLLKIFCLLSSVSLLLTGCWTEAPVESANGLLGSEEPEEEAEVILPADFALPYAAAQTLDPVTCPDGMQQVVGSLLYEGLFRLDRQLEPQPYLCQSYTYDAASLTYTFTLQSGVTFSDGSPLTAADVAATLRRAQSSQRYGARLSGVASISAGESTVAITLSSPDTGFPALLDIPIVKSGTETSLTPVGTGPYVLTTDEGGTCLAARTDWWGGGGQPIQRITLSDAQDRDAMLYQFSSHTVQLITADLIGTESITATGNISYQDVDTTILHYIGFNTRRELFQQPVVRRALGLGINRATLVSAVLSGHGREAQFPVSPASPLYPSSLETLYSYDGFASAMEAAGLATGQSNSTVTLLVNQENSFKVAAAEYIADALSDFDLQVQVEALPWADFTAALAAGNFDLYYGEVKLSANWDLSGLIGSGGALNYGGWADAQTDQLLTAYASAEDRASAMADLCAYLAEQAPILPICFSASSVLYQTGVITGLTPTASEPFYDLSAWEIHLQEN